MSLVLLARGKAEGRNGGAERSENSMAGVIESGPRAEAEKFIQNRDQVRGCVYEIRSTVALRTDPIS